MKACCEFFGLSRSAYYRRPRPKAAAADASLRRAIQDIAGKYPRYGSRRITAQLALPPYALRISRNRVRQLMAAMNLLVKVKPRRGAGTSKHGFRRYPNLVKGRQATRPEEIWVADITCIRLRSDEAWLAIVLDVFTRAIRGWALRRSAGQGLTLEALNMALKRHGAPTLHHSDQGVQYAAKAYVAVLEGAGAKISMAAAGKPTENGYAERVIRTIKEEEVYLSEYRSLAEARAQIAYFIDEVYRHKRIHSALAYQTPARFEAEWRQNTL